MRRLSYSRLKHLDKSYNNFLHSYTEVYEPAEALIIGNAFEVLLLDPSAFYDKYHVEKLDLRTKAGKALKIGIEESKKILLSPDQLTLIENMVKALKENPEIELPEKFTYQEEFEFKWMGIDCKSFTDIIDHENQVIYDVKTINDILDYERSMTKFGYYMQAAFYVQAVASEYFDFYEYKMVFVEKKVPYNSIIRTVSQEFIEAGEAKIKELINKLKHHEDNNVYGGFDDGKTVIEKPAWLII